MGDIEHTGDAFGVDCPACDQISAFAEASREAQFRTMESRAIAAEAQLRGAVGALTEDEVAGLQSAINAAVHHGVLTGERVDALRARVDALRGR